jgi:hypothetical protein
MRATYDVLTIDEFCEYLKSLQIDCIDIGDISVTGGEVYNTVDVRTGAVNPVQFNSKTIHSPKKYSLEIIGIEKTK